MKAASITDIKRELKTLGEEELMHLCLRMARFKRDNKELLTYLLFEARDEEAYVEMIKEEIADSFDEMNQIHSYYTKKSVRKVLRNLGKYIRYSGNKQTEVEILLCFCEHMRDSNIDLYNIPVLHNLYRNQIKKIEKALDTLHEDLRYDYEESLLELPD